MPAQPVPMTAPSPDTLDSPLQRIQERLPHLLHILDDQAARVPLRDSVLDANIRQPKPLSRGLRVATLCGADMPSGPDVHAAIRVRMDGRELLVDVGYAAPFYEPIPLDLPTSYSFRFGRDAYVVHPRDDEGRTRLELQREGTLAHAYLLKPAARTIAHFRRAIRASYREDATFMRSLLLVRFLDSQSITILNRLRIDSGPDGFSLHELATLDRVVEEIVSAFDMEEDVVRAAVTDLPELESPYG